LGVEATLEGVDLEHVDHGSSCIVALGCLDVLGKGGVSVAANEEGRQKKRRDRGVCGESSHTKKLREGDLMDVELADDKILAAPSSSSIVVDVDHLLSSFAKLSVSPSCYSERSVGDRAQVFYVPYIVLLVNLLKVSLSWLLGLFL
jgi:hypothetical protein